MRIDRLLLQALVIVAAGAVFTAAFPETHILHAASAPVRPFSVGERTVYEIKWDPPWYLFFLPAMKAGEVEIRLDAMTDYRNRTALKIVFHARSSGTLSRLTGLHIDNIFTYYTDPVTFCTMGVDNIVREGNRKRHIETHYDYETARLHFRETNEAVDPPEIMKDLLVEDIPACVHDPLSALFVYRTTELRAKHKHSLMLGNNDKVNEVSLQVEKKEWIATPIGKTHSWKVGVSSLLGELFRESGRLSLWFSSDENRLPVQFEIRVRLGKVVGELTEFHP